MNKNFVTIAIAGVLVVSVGLIVVISNKGDQSQISDNQVQNQDKKDNTYVSSDGKTLEDFMSGALGLNVVCDFSHEVGKDNTLNGVTYIAGDKVRVDYELKNEVDGQKDLHMISDGEYGYVWGNSILGREMQGSKFKINVEDEEGSEETSSNDYLDYSAAVANCRTWNPDMSLFEIPEDIQFMDMEEMSESITEEMMQQAQTEMVEEGEVQEGEFVMDCSICDSMPEAQRAACLEGVGCEE